MKKAALTALLAVVSLSLFSYCPIVTTLSNSTIPCASGLSSDSSQVHAYLWLQGKADWTTNGTGQVSPGSCTAGGTTGGCDSDGVDLMDETCLFDGTSIIGPWDLCASGNPGEYYLFTDWANYVFDGCPSNDSSERAILLIYDDDGKYILQSRSQGKDWDNWDEIGTMGASVFSLSTGSISTSGDEGANQADITFTAIPDALKKGSYSTGDAPTSAPVTGFRLYFYSDSSAPTDFASSAWTAGDVFSATTTSVSNYTFPDTPCNGFMSRALIIDGKELPFVSSGYTTIAGSAYPDGGEDRDICSCSGICFWNEDQCWPYGPPYTLDALIDGTELILGACGDPWIYSPECEVAHTIQWRTRIGTVASCWSEARTMIDHNETPVAPVITSIVDNDPNAQNGIKIYYTPGSPAYDHVLFRDGYIFIEGYVSGSTILNTDCNMYHDYRVAARNYGSNVSCYWINSNTVSAADQCVGEPPEIATGLTSMDAQMWSADKKVQSWPAEPSATGYALYIGRMSHLDELATGAENCGIRYCGTSTSVDLSSDDPRLWEGRCFWYLVTAYNANGEGPAGTGRIINSSGACP